MEQTFTLDYMTVSVKSLSITAINTNVNVQPKKTLI